MAEDIERAQKIFLAAVDKFDLAEREACLNEACGTDETLRRQVEALLHRHADAARLDEAPRVPIPVTVDEPVRERPGTVVGPYKLLEQIGQGGFGVVFMAEQQRPMRRKVALKILKPGMDSKQVIARFEAERQALALMDHPNIARVLDGGETGSGRPYFVMELVRGFPVTQFCDDNRLPVAERLELFIHVCQAVQHAHVKGIIHRDLKPSNILVTLHDGIPVVKVIDFGIAKALGQQLTDKTLFTNFAQFVGTPLYMSPEQAEMSGLDVDTRSDIYSLGVLLYELLTGTTPFDRDRLRTASYDEIRRIIREEEPARPSKRLSSLGPALTQVSARRNCDPRRLSRLFRGELDWIVMKALEKDRNRRYDTASALAADVQHYLHGEPIQACPPTATYKLRKYARKHRKAFLLATGFMALLVVGAGISAWQAVRAIVAEQGAVRERKRAEANFRLARDAVDRYFTKVSESPALKTIGLENLRKDLLLQAKEFYERFITEQPEETGLQADLGKAYGRLGKICATLGETAAAEAQYEKAIAIFEALTHKEPGDAEHLRSLAHAQRELGQMLRATSRPEKARVFLEQAATVAETLAHQYADQPAYRHELALAYHALAGLGATKRWPSSEEAYQAAIRIEEELIQGDPDDSGQYRSTLAASAGDLAEIYRVAGKAQAETYFRRAMHTYKDLARMFPQEESYQHNLATQYHGLSSFYQDTHHLKQAEAPLQEAVAIAEQLVRAHPEVLDYAVLLANSYSRLARLANNRGNPRDVQAWSAKGVKVMQRVIAKEPRHLQARRELNDLWIGQAVALAQHSEYVQAAKTADEVARQEGLTPVDFYNVACVYSRCAEAAAKDATKSEAERAKSKEQYANRAMASLHHAVDRGFKNLPALQTEVDLNALRGRGDFKQLLRQVEKMQ